MLFRSLVGLAASRRGLSRSVRESRRVRPAYWKKTGLAGVAVNDGELCPRRASALAPPPRRTSTRRSMTMGWKISVGSDNAGYGYKEELKALLEADDRVEKVVDVGVTGREDGTYYPNIAVEAAEKIAAGEVDRGLLICGTGMGVAIAANKVSGVRAVTAHDLYSVQRSVLSNNAQVLTMGERVVGLELRSEEHTSELQSRGHLVC